MTVPVAGTGYTVDDGRGELKLGTMKDPQTATTAATLTAAQLLGGVLEGSAGTSGVNYTLPAYTVLEAAMENPRVNQCFDLTIINLGTSSGVITIVAGTGFTLVGMMTLPIVTSAGSSGTFRFRKTSATTWKVYRIS